jgi:hypothetical protein
MNNESELYHHEHTGNTDRGRRSLLTTAGYRRGLAPTSIDLEGPKLSLCPEEVESDSCRCATEPEDMLLGQPKRFGASSWTCLLGNASILPHVHCVLAARLTRSRCCYRCSRPTEVLECWTDPFPTLRRGLVTIAE